MTREERIAVYESAILRDSLTDTACAIREWAKGRGFESHVHHIKTLIENSPTVSDEEWLKAEKIIDDLFTAQQIALEASENGEFLEYLRKPGMDDHLPEVEGVHAEWADVLVRLLHRGHRLGIEKCLEAFQKKLVYNEGRPERHGGKAF